MSGFARMIERAGEFDFKPHPHMLRHACGFALANKGHDTRALSLTSATATSSPHGAIHRVVAGRVQGLLAMTKFVWLIGRHRGGASTRCRGNSPGFFPRLTGW